jgi:predicted nuclease of restriction endonuclease-like (RecB) superfamily
MAPRQTKPAKSSTPPAYDALVDEIASLVESARRVAARSVNVLMTTTYWLIGQRIVEREQAGALRAAYGEQVMVQLAADLTTRLGRGYSVRNLRQMRAFYLGWAIRQTASAELCGDSTTETRQMSSAESEQARAVPQFPLPWSHYVRLLAVKNRSARTFYETEALRGGWSHAQLDRQIQSQFYERTALSRDKAAMLRKGAKPESSDLRRAEAEIKDPYVLEFLSLKDEYAESDLEDALVAKLEQFLLELGGDFTFVGRQRRLRIGDEWYRVDLLFFHRRLRCLVIIDLKLGKFTHADAGQMHLYLNYAREHWTLPAENPPVGLILCAERDHAVARYALEGLPNKVLAAEYRTALPAEHTLVEQIEEAQRQVETHVVSPASRPRPRRGRRRVR